MLFGICPFFEFNSSSFAKSKTNYPLNKSGKGTKKYFQLLLIQFSLKVLSLSNLCRSYSRRTLR